MEIKFFFKLCKDIKDIKFGIDFTTFQSVRNQRDFTMTDGEPHLDVEVVMLVGIGVAFLMRCIKQILREKTTIFFDKVEINSNYFIDSYNNSLR